MSMKRPQEANLLIGIGIFGALAICLYWVAWYAVPSLIQARSPEAQDYAIYVNFEQAFPLADGWLAVAVLLGVAGLWKMRDWGFLFMLVVGGSAIFLGLMDLLYDLEHQMFVPLTSEATIELIIVILEFLLGILVIYLAWRLRRLFVR
jgi:hypothetical protein